MRIADGQTVRWREGEVTVIDDSFEHELWYEAEASEGSSTESLASKARLILIIDLWHPDLSLEERGQVPGLKNGRNIDASSMTTKAYMYANSLAAKKDSSRKDEL